MSCLNYSLYFDRDEVERYDKICRRLEEIRPLAELSSRTRYEFNELYEELYGMIETTPELASLTRNDINEILKD